MVQLLSTANGESALFFHEAQGELGVRLALHLEKRLVARVARHSQVVAAAIEREASLADLGDDGGVFDAVQGVGGADAGARLGGVVDDDQHAARLQGLVEAAVHGGAVGGRVDNKPQPL